MNPKNNVIAPYFLINSEGLDEVRDFQKKLNVAIETLQEQLEELKDVMPLEKKLFTLAEAAKYLAISESFLRKDCSEGPRKNRTPGPDPVKIGDMIRYEREELDKWVAKHKRDRVYMT